MNELITVIMTTYNHERFIKEAIDSILNQDYENFELIIVDDGSKDSTKSIINNYNDNRICKIYKTNSGVSDATNRGIAQAKGEWIALMSGDDVSRQDRLSIEYNYAKDGNYKIVFSLPQLINENGEKLNDSLLQVMFRDNDIQKEKILNRLFYTGNYFCAPSALIKKEIFDEIGGFKRSLLQLQDYAMWIEIAKRYDMPIISERLINYRQHTNNLSSKNNDKRLMFEFKQVYRDFFRNMSWDLIDNVFPNKLNLISKTNDIFLNIEKAMILADCNITSAREVGLELLSNYINDDEYYRKMIVNYNFKMSRYYEASNNY